MRRRDDTHVDEIIDHVRLFLQQRIGHDVQKKGSPDRDERNARACDAILQGGGTLFAVEHTALDSFRGQRKDDARFRDVLGQLEHQLKDQLLDHIDLCIPTHAIVPGHDWRAITDALRSWLLAHFDKVPYDQWGPVTIPAVPFAVHVRRERSAGPGSLFVMRWTVPDHQTQRIEVIVERLMDKSEVLQRYKEQGYRSVLVIESNDWVLVNRDILCRDFQSATQMYPPQALEEVVLIQTGTRPWCMTPLWQGGEAVKTPRPCWPTAPGYPLKGTQWESL